MYKSKQNLSYSTININTYRSLRIFKVGLEEKNAYQYGSKKCLFCYMHFLLAQNVSYDKQKMNAITLMFYVPKKYTISQNCYRQIQCSFCCCSLTTVVMKQSCFKVRIMCMRNCLSEAALLSSLIPRTPHQNTTDPSTTQNHCAEMLLHFTFQTTTHTLCITMIWSQCRHKQRQPV